MGISESHFSFFRSIIPHRKVAGGSHTPRPLGAVGPGQARSILSRRVARQEQTGCTGLRSSHSPSPGTRSAWKYAATAWQQLGPSQGATVGRERGQVALGGSQGTAEPWKGCRELRWGLGNLHPCSSVSTISTILPPHCSSRAQGCEGEFGGEGKDSILSPQSKFRLPRAPRLS